MLFLTQKGSPMVPGYFKLDGFVPKKMMMIPLNTEGHPMLEQSHHVANIMWLWLWRPKMLYHSWPMFLSPGLVISPWCCLNLCNFRVPHLTKKKQEQSFLPVKFLVFAGETPTVCFLDKLRCFPTNCYTLCGAWDRTCWWFLLHLLLHSTLVSSPYHQFESS